jgi:hypothetical protein
MTQARSAVVRLPTGIGAVIMAGGIFGAVALQRIPGAGAVMTRPLAVVLALGWAGVAAALLASAAKEGFAAHTGAVVGSFAIGTWVAGSVVVARMAMLAAPSVLWPADGLFAVSVALWAWFMPQALRNLLRIAAAPAAETRPTGVILLTTVATQAVALLAFRLFPGIAAVHGLATLLIGLGAACYAGGLLLIVRRYLRNRHWRLATDWDNTNCILHGALSVTGLAAVVSDRFGVAAITPFWAATGVVFVIVESIEIARLAARLRAFGWRDAVFVYDTSQWARNFTFGMFYAFTAATAGHFDVTGNYPLLGAVQGAILGYGQYLVLALLAGELALWLADAAKARSI